MSRAAPARNPIGISHPSPWDASERECTIGGNAARAGVGECPLRRRSNGASGMRDQRRDLSEAIDGFRVPASTVIPRENS